MKLKLFFLTIFIFITVNQSYSQNYNWNQQQNNKKIRFSVPGKEDKWFAHDKLQHFSSSMFLVLTPYYYQNRYFDMSHKKSLKNSINISFSLGLTKELLDMTSPKGFFSIKDLVVDIMGIGTGVFILNQIK